MLFKNFREGKRVLGMQKIDDQQILRDKVSQMRKIGKFHEINFGKEWRKIANSQKFFRLKSIQYRIVKKWVSQG